jgi:hypothetical protein
MKLVNLIPLKEIDFRNQDQFDDYQQKHNLRPDTKVTIAGKATTAGQAAKNSEPTKGTSVFGKDKGGSVFGKSDGMETVKSIAAKTGLRAQAVAGWADENGVNLSKVADAIDSKKLKPMDFMTAVSGNPGNKYAKDVIAKYSQSASNIDIDIIADLTDNNDHNGAVMALAKMMGDKSSTAEMEKIQKYHNLKGHMPQSLIKYRSSILNNLFAQAKKKYGDKFVKQLQNSF